MSYQQLFLSLRILVILLVFSGNLSSQILQQTDHIVRGGTAAAESDCFNNEILNSPEIDLESFCFSTYEIGEGCLVTVERENSLCYSFEQFYPSCAPATIHKVEFRVRATSSLQCEVPMKFVVIDEAGKTITASEDGESTFITSITENQQEALNYQICLDYESNATVSEGCEYCIDGIERVITYECTTEITSCCTPSGVRSDPFEHVYMNAGEVTPAYQADFINSGQSTFEELSINEVQLLGNSTSNFVEIKGNPNQEINDYELVILDSNFGQSPGQVFRRVPIDNKIIPSSGLLLIKPNGSPDEVYVQNNLRFGVRRNLSLLLIKKDANAGTILDVDDDDNSVVDSNINVINGVDIIQSTLFPESVYARSVGYEVYTRPSSINRTLTYMSDCIWHPADPSKADAMLTPGRPNARVYWVLGYQDSDEIIRILPDYDTANGTSFTELEDGKFCVKPVILYENSNVQADLSSVSTLNDITSIIEGGGLCGKIGPCTPITVGPCDFNNFNIPDVTICKGDCANIDLNSTCEITSEYCVSWGDPVGFLEVHNTAIEVCPSETTVYPLTITDENGNYVTSKNVTVNVVCADASIVPEYPIICNGPTEILAQTSLENPTFNWSDGSNSSSVLVSEEGSYSVTITDVNGCSESASVNVYSSQEAELSITTDSENICANGVAVLNATVGAGYVDTYQWSTGESTEQIEVAQSGTYGLTVTNFDGCTSEASYTVDQSSDQAPNAQISLSSTELCQGGRIMLSVEESENNTYSWSNGATQSSITIFIADTYSVTVTNVEGCQSTAELVIDDNPAESLQVELNAPDPAVICNGASVMLGVSVSPASSSYTVLWSSNSIPTTYPTENIDVTIPGEYTVTVTSDAGCETTQSVTVEESTLDFNLTAEEETICTGGSTRIDFSMNAGEPNEISWSNGDEGEESIIVSSPGVYELIITDDKGCSVSKSVEIMQSTEEGLTVDLSADPEKLCGDDDLDITATITDATGAASYDNIVWSEGTTMSESITINEAGDYSITVTADNGCKTVAEIEIEDEESFFENNCFISIPISSSIPVLIHKDTDILNRSSSNPLTDLVVDIPDTGESINVSDILGYMDPPVDLRYSNDGASFKDNVEDYENGVEMAWAHVETQDDGSQLLYIGSNASTNNDNDQAILNSLVSYWDENQSSVYNFGALPINFSCGSQQICTSHVPLQVLAELQQYIFGCSSDPAPGGFVPKCWYECALFNEEDFNEHCPESPIPFTPIMAGVIDATILSIEGAADLLVQLDKLGRDYMVYTFICGPYAGFGEEFFECIETSECEEEALEQIIFEIEGIKDALSKEDEDDPTNGSNIARCNIARDNLIKAGETFEKLKQFLISEEGKEAFADAVNKKLAEVSGESGFCDDPNTRKECNLEKYEIGKVFFELISLLAGVVNLDDAYCIMAKMLSNKTTKQISELKDILTDTRLRKIQALAPDLKAAYADAALHLDANALKKLIDEPDKSMLRKWADLNKIGDCALAPLVCAARTASSTTFDCDAMKKFFGGFYNDILKNVDNLDNANLLTKKLKDDLFSPPNEDLARFFEANPNNGWKGWSGLADRAPWIRNNILLLNKLVGESDEFISTLNNFYKKSWKKPAVINPPPGIKSTQYGDIPFDDFGFPNFKNYISDQNHVVQIPDLTGKPTDFTKGKNALQSYLDLNGGGLVKKSNLDGGWSPFYIEKNGVPEGPYTWHHHQDGKTLMPVRSEVHNAGKPHSGGATILNPDPDDYTALKGLFEYN